METPKLAAKLLVCMLTVVVESRAFHYGLNQPQIYVDNGNMYVIPAEHKNLYLVSNGTGKIVFNDVELTSLVGSIRNSTRDISSFKRIFGVPANTSAGFTSRIDHLEQSFRRLSQMDDLDTRLITVERQLMYNRSSTSTPQVSGLNRRFRDLQRRVEAVETRLRSMGNSNNNPCSSNPCQNGGTCIPTMFGGFCWCPVGWEGDRCQFDVDECTIFQGTDLGCQNGATCTNTPGSYRCTCRSGWMGIHCARRSGGCSSGPVWELCGHGLCVDQSTGSRPYTCICDQGWKTDGTNPACNVDVDECNGPHPSCSKNPMVVCINSPGSFHCGPCPPGYTGNGYYCTDINECLVGNGGCSMNPMVQCINTLGSRTCGECPPGYIGTGITCQFVGMCQVNNGGCHPLARCVENPAIGQSFVQCLCPAGYTGTGMGLHGCFPYGTGPATGGSAVGPPVGNPCVNNPCVHGTCYPAGNSFTCSCLPGYMGTTCAIQIDPCLQNPCQNGGTCVRAGTGYTCRCPNDFTGLMCEVQEQSCGGDLNGLEGVLRYPHSGGEEYGHMRSCIWRIYGLIGKAINVTFTNFHLEGSSACQFDWLQIHDGDNIDAPTIGRFCGNDLPNSFVSTHHVLTLKFQSDGSIAGLGFALAWNVTDPACGGIIDNQTHGAISSPGYPGLYPHSRDCVWKLSVGPGKRIHLVFAAMRLEVHSNCSYDYLQVLDGAEDSAHQLAIFCNTTLPPPLTSSGSHVTIRFHTDSSQADTGFHIAFSEVPGVPGCGGIFTASAGVITSPHHPEPYAHGLDCEWYIRLPSPESINIEFLTFQLEHARGCRYDFVEVRENGPDGRLVGRYCGRNAPQPYRSTSSTLYVRFKSDESVAYEGFRLKYDTACGGLFTSETGILRSPYHPRNYPHNRNCVYLISQPVGKAIQMDFEDFEVESGVDTRCLFDYLEVRDGDNGNSSLIGHYCGTQTPETVISSMNYLWIRFKTDGSVQNRGFRANYSTIDVGCGGILRGTKLGVLQSPGHPEVYPHGVNCKWIIRGEPGEIIRLTWLSFSLETNQRCAFDFVEVFDNSTMYETGHSMGRYCGSNTPPVMTSTDNTVTIVFRSDHSVAHEGFSASYSVLNASRSCGGNYLTQFGTLTSPGYPNRYPHRRSCAWTIKVPAGKQLRLNVSEFEVENGTARGCIYDYLEIRNGGLETSPLIGKFCSSNKPPRLIPSFSNAMYLKFSSDTSRSYKGFKITWDGASTGCGGTLVGSPQGSIASPNYPQHYGIRTECIWKVSVNPGSLIQVVFTDLDIQQSSTCWGEYVELRDGLNRNSKVIGKYCHADSPLIVNTTSNNLRIKYVSQFGGSGRGFYLNYNTVCNRVITGFGSVIESPNFPNAYPHNRNCTWEIRATQGNMVNMSFSHFNVEGPARNSCRYDFVEVSEVTRFSGSSGVPNNSPRQRIGKYCGTNVPTLISSTKDTVFINFVSDASLAFNGFRMEWVLSGCGGKLGGNWGQLKSPNYPLHYPAAVTCMWQITTAIGTKIQLNIWDLDVETHTDCEFDYLQIFSGETEQDAEITKLCHKERNSMKVIQSHGNHMLVKFVSDSGGTGKGFWASYNSLAGGCGGVLVATQGNIYSPNWPNNYDHNADCGWRIVVDDSHVAQLEFTDFDVENHVNCSYDYVAVYDGGNARAPLLLQHCGSELPPMVVASGNEMFVVFKSDLSSSAKGFKANFSTGCGARLTAKSGEITTIGSSKRGFNCTWIISGNSTEHVTLTFTYMDVHSDMGWNSRNRLTNGTQAGCDQIYVEVFDGEDEDAPSVGKFCGSTVPPALTSRGGSFVVKLFTSRAMFYRGEGFRATYEVSSSACGGLLSSMQGSFTSPNYPVGYPLNAECQWNVLASPGNKVQLTFRDVNLESSEFCNTDFVEIHENDATGRLLGHFCGNTLPSNITAENKLWVLFRSDNEGQAPGFWADYVLAHGNELNGTIGTVASPLWPQGGAYKGDFYWRITVSEGRAIELRFQAFEIGYTYVSAYRATTCDRYPAEFTVHDGYDATAPVLLTQCDQTLPPVLTSSGNVVYLYLRRDYPSFGKGKFKLVWREVPMLDRIISPTTNISGCGGTVLVTPGNRSTILSPGYPVNYFPNMLCEWYVFTDQHHKLVLNIEDLQLEGSPTCYYDRLEIYDGSGESSSTQSYTLNTTLCQRISAGAQLVARGRALKLVMTTDGSVQYAGFNITATAACGGIIQSTKGEIGRLTSPGFGSGNYGHNICEWSILVRPGRTIKVSFSDFDIYAGGTAGVETSCSTDTLVLRNGGHADSPMLGRGRYCGQTKPPDLETSSNQLHVKFTSYTNGGRGFALTYSEVSASCGGQIQLTDEVKEYLFLTPNYPNSPPPFTECEWIISVPPNEAVQIDFLLNFGITNTRNCEQAGLEIRDGGTRLSPVIRTFCSNIMPGTQRSTGNHIYLRYYTSVNEPAIGFKAKASVAKCGGTVVGNYGTITSPNYPNTFDADYCLWTIRAQEGRSIQVFIQNLQLNGVNDNCTLDRLLVTEENVTDVDNPRNWTACGAIPSSNFRPVFRSSTNMVHVVFYAGPRSPPLPRKFSISFRATTERCGGTLRAPSGVIESPGYPRGYPHYKNCWWTISVPNRRIRLEFLDFDLEEKIITPTKQYCVDFVHVYQSFGFSVRLNDSTTSLYGGKICGSELPPAAESTHSTVNIRFRTDHSVSHRGFKVRYTSELPVLCGGAIPANDTTGYISSPNRTTNTPNTTTSTVCVWEKAWSSSRNNATTTVLIHSLNIPQPGQPAGAPKVPCKTGGFLSIAPRSDQSYSYKKYCGSVQNQKINLLGDYFHINYEAPTSAGAFFNVSYKVSPCGGNIYGPANITSPNFPSVYPTDVACIWILEYSYNSQIRLSFTDLDLDESQNSEGCDKDYVVVRNGRYPTSPVLGKYCGTNIPNQVVSMSRNLFVEFYSDSNANGNRRGFRIEAEEMPRGCGGTVHAKYGAVRSPRGTRSNSGARTQNSKYPSNTECEWIIETVPGYQLSFLFTGRFDIENSTNCTNDYVEIFTERNDGWSSRGKFCGKQIPSGFNSTSTRAKVLFHSNEAVEADGFTLNWYSRCGGMFNDSQGEIRSAAFDTHEQQLSVNSFNFWSYINVEKINRVQKCDYVIQGNSPDDYIVGEFLDPFHVSAPTQLFDLDAGDVNPCPMVNVSVWQGNSSLANNYHRVGFPHCGDSKPPAFIARGAATISYNFLANFENYGFRLRYNIYQCGGRITEARRITSPGHPFTSAPNMNCTWIVEAPANKVVRIKFEKLDLEFHPSCIFDAVYVFDGSLINDSQRLGVFCGNLTSDIRPLTSRSRTMVIQFLTDYSVQHTGFDISVDFTLGPEQNCGGLINLTSTGSTASLVSPDADRDGKYDSMLDCEWMIIAPDFHMIELSFSSFNLEGARSSANRPEPLPGSDPCPYDLLEIRDGPGPLSDSLGKFCGTVLPPRLTSSTNFMWIVFKSDASYNFPGFRATVTSRQSPCGVSAALNATEIDQYLTSPGYPENYGTNIRCRYIVTGARFSDEVEIHFVDVDIEHSPDCAKDRLQIRDVSDSYLSRNGISGQVLFNGVRNRDWRFANTGLQMDSIMKDQSYCGSLRPLPPDFVSIARSAEIIFETDSSGSGKGFKLMYRRAGCNRTYSQPQGRIFSREWPTSIPVFTSCVFRVTAANNSYISLYFNLFQMADSPGCSDGAMEIRDGSQSGNLLAQYCGNTIPNPIFSATNVLWVKYFTRMGVSRGFDITYVTTPYGRGCGGDVFHTEGSIASPFYPGNYSVDSDCVWKLRVPAALRIGVQFTTFDIGADCERNFLELSSMNSHALSEDPILIARYCAGDNPAAYRGTSDMLMIRYKTNRNNTGNGWRLTFDGQNPTELPS